MFCQVRFQGACKEAHEKPQAVHGDAAFCCANICPIIITMNDSLLLRSPLQKLLGVGFAIAFVFMGMPAVLGIYPCLFGTVALGYLHFGIMALRLSQTCNDEARYRKSIQLCIRLECGLIRAFLILVAAAVVVHANLFGLRAALADAPLWLPKATDGLLNYVNSVVNEFISFFKNGGIHS